MTHYHDLANIKVRQAISEGVESQQINRLRQEGQEDHVNSQNPGYLARLSQLGRKLFPTARRTARDEQRESSTNPVG